MLIGNNNEKVLELAHKIAARNNCIHKCNYTQ